MASGDTKIRGITIAIGGDTSGLSKALKESQSELNTVEKILKDVNKLARLDPENVELSAQKFEYLAQKAEALKSRLSLLQGVYETMQKNAPDTYDEGYQRGLDAIKREILETQKALEDTSKELDTVSDKLRGDQFNEFGGSIRTLITSELYNLKQALSELTAKPLSEVFDTIAEKADALHEKLEPVSDKLKAVFTTGLNNYMTFESAFVGVQKTVEATEYQYDELREGIRKMATETNSSAEEIARVMEVAGQLGVSGVDNLLKFTKTAVMLGDSTTVSAEEAADKLARFMNVTGDDIGDIDKLGASIVDLGNNFATTEGEIIKMAQRISSAGTLAGLSSTDILGLATAVTSVGVKADAGGTAVTQTLNTIVKAVESAGGATNDLVKDVQTVIPNAYNAKDVIAELSKEFADGASETEVYTSAIKKYNLSEEEATAVTKKISDYAKSSVHSFEDLTLKIRSLDLETKASEKDLVNYTYEIAEMFRKGATETEVAEYAAEKFGIGMKDAYKVMQAAESYNKNLKDSYTDLSEEIEDSGKKLEKMASLTGMTSEEFAKLWKNNPTEAFSLFIKSLSNLDDEAESTTTILAELGMSGIRQSNVLRSLTLSTDNMERAVKTSNKAYKENTALTTEANKRYATLEAKINQTKERLKRVGSEIGERLLPIADKVIDFVETLEQKWDGLDDSTQDLIVTSGELFIGLTAGLGVLSKLASGASSLVSVFGTLAAHPALALVGVAVAGIAAATVSIIKNSETATEVYEKTFEKASKLNDEQQRLYDSTKTLQEEWSRLGREADLNVGIGDKEIQSVRDYWDALQKVVNDEGKIKEDAIEDAKVIVEEINKSLGTHLSVQDGVVQGYKDIAASIDTVIAKKRADIYLDAYREKYVKALQYTQGEGPDKIWEAQQMLIDQDNKIQNQRAKEAQAYKYYTDLVKEHNKRMKEGAGMSTEAFMKERSEITKAEKAWQEELATLDGYIAARKDLETVLEGNVKLLDEASNTVTNYESLVETAAYNSAVAIDQASNAVKYSLKTATSATRDELEKQKNHYKNAYDAILAASKESGTKITKQQVKNAKEAAEASEREWALSGVRAMQKYSAGMLQGIDANSASLNTLYSILNGTYGVTLVNKSKEWGAHFTAEYVRYMADEVVKPERQRAVRKLAEAIEAMYHFSVPDEGPMSSADNWAPDFVKLYASGIRDNAYILENEAEKLAQSVTDILNPEAVIGMGGSSQYGIRINGDNPYMTQTSYNNSLGGVNINVYAAAGQSVDDIANAVSEVIAEQYYRQERAFAR